MYNKTEKCETSMLGQEFYSVHSFQALLKDFFAIRTFCSQQFLQHVFIL